MSNEVLENIKSRRSVRTYTERQVSAGDLNLILEAAAYAPSGMNFQTWHFTAIQDAAVLTELNDLKSASNLNGNLNCSKELEHYAS